jgi:hypothetical protein
MRSRSTALVGVGIAACASVALWRWNGERARWAGELDRARAANADLEKRLRVAEASRADTPPHESSPAPPAPDLRGPRTAGSTTEAATRAELIRLVEDNQQKLAAAQEALAEMRNQHAELAARIEQLTIENQNLARAEAELKERVDNQVRLASSLQGELKERGERALQLELSNRELRRRGEESGAKLAQLVKTAGELDDLSRRREVYLSSILRRYREVTDLYRNVTPGADTPNADQTRIQNALGMADEDLKQLQALNAQAGRLQRALAGARQAALP